MWRLIWKAISPHQPTASHRGPLKNSRVQPLSRSVVFKVSPTSFIWYLSTSYTRSGSSSSEAMFRVLTGSSCIQASSCRGLKLCTVPQQHCPLWIMLLYTSKPQLFEYGQELFCLVAAAAPLSCKL